MSLSEDMIVDTYRIMNLAPLYDRKSLLRRYITRAHQYHQQHISHGGIDTLFMHQSCAIKVWFYDNTVDIDVHRNYGSQSCRAYVIWWSDAFIIKNDELS